jgi:signal transduction histidine kinase
MSSRRYLAWAAMVALVLLIALGTALETPAHAPAAFQSPTGQVALNTIATFSASAVAYLALGRYMYQRLARDLAIFMSFSVLALANLLFSVVPAMGLAPSLGHTPASAVIGGLAAGGVFLTAAFLGQRHVAPAKAHKALLYATASVLLLVFLAWYGSRGLPQHPIGVVLSADNFGTAADTYVLSMEFIGAAFYGVATVGWARRARNGDKLAIALVVAAVMATFSRLNFALATSPSSQRTLTANVLRLVFYAALLAGSAQEVRADWAKRAQLAVLAERHRIARDLHDGLAQEVTFALRQASLVSGARGKAIASALERALAESRRALATLNRPLGEPIDVALAQVAEEAAARFGAKVSLDLGGVVVTQPQAQDCILRVAQEAVSNAARHSAGSNIVVRLAKGGATTLSVSDDGRGFDLEEARRLWGRFGLVSMRERTEAVGGQFRVVSAPGSGTTVSVELP